MQKLTLTLFALMIFLCGCDSKTKEVSALSEDKIYFFYYNECPYCHNAIEYIDKKYPELNMAMVNIYVGNGFELFKECGQKFNLGNSIGTPLFCMGDKYLMGWSDANAQKFDKYVQPFLKTNK